MDTDHGVGRVIKMCFFNNITVDDFMAMSPDSLNAFRSYYGLTVDDVNEARSEFGKFSGGPPKLAPLPF